MLSETIKTLRKQKGFTQEELAIRLNVVRQTVSKWEKGLSVPDSDMLIKLADVLETDVAVLLGGEMIQNTSKKADEVSNSEIIEQLSRINEQLAVKNRRAKRIWKAVIGIIIAGIIVFVIAVSFGIANHSRAREIFGTTSYVCTLDSKEYYYELEYNENYEIINAGGDAYIGYMLETQTDANRFDAMLKDYFETKGGTVKVSSTGNPLAANIEDIKD